MVSRCGSAAAAFLQVTANGISHIQWHPSSEALIVAAADKSGNVGMWHVDHDSASEGVAAIRSPGLCERQEAGQ